MLASQPWNAGGNERVLWNGYFLAAASLISKPSPVSADSGNCGFLEAQQQGYL